MPHKRPSVPERSVEQLEAEVERLREALQQIAGDVWPVPTHSTAGKWCRELAREALRHA